MKTTLFLLTSLDGKISTGSVDERDFDKDLPTIPEVSEGLSQYYELEKQTDWHSFITGKVLAKVGWNEVKENVERVPVRFVIVDNQPHLNQQGIKNLLDRCEKVYIATTNPHHPALAMTNRNLQVFTFDGSIDFAQLFADLEQRGAKSMTIQSGGDMNAVLLRTGLINEVSIVIAPLLVGGKDTPSLVSGNSLVSSADLADLKVLDLYEVNQLERGYLHLRYKVRNARV